MRIVSLVPAGTDSLFALGLGSDVVGVSHECDHPADVPPPRFTRSVVETGRLSSAEIDAAGGGCFTRPGPRLVTGIEVLASVFHPDVVNWPVAADVFRRWS